MAGAPVSAELHGLVKKIIAEDGETLIPYGATEALPIANFAGSECTETAGKTAEGAGYCVGRPIPPMEIKVIKMIDGPIDSWSENLILPAKEIGEIVVKGPVVTPEYYNEPEQTKNAKIADAAGKIWHRMGDAGYFDEKGRLWFCGRKSHMVVTENGILYSVCCEAIFNKHPKVFRTALVGLGKVPNQIPVIVVEPVSGAMPRTESEKEKFIRELLELGKGKDFTSRISHFLFHPSFPVDIRHNAKIFREKLALWAESQGK